MDILKLKYGAKEALNYTEEEIEECAQLFSNSYGKYSDVSPIRPGENVRMSKGFFKKRFQRENIYIATARYRGELVGQAVYIRKKYDDVGIMTWIMQLVVNEKFRKHGIGSTLLHSIWGFSNDFAWGLATANPCTVKALESATLRKCDPEVIAKNLKYIKRLSDEISFVKEDEYLVDGNGSMANTDFFVDNHDYVEPHVEMSDWRLGELKPGYEWIAFTFRSQELDPEKYQKYFVKMVEFSELKLKEAYGRMKMTKHPWSKGTVNEVDTILAGIHSSEIHSVLDLGCGTGRHAIEFAKRGYDTVGVDFSSKHIRTAKQNGKDLPVDFYTKDVREYRDGKKYDLIVSMYDVVGSFPDEKENVKIIQTAYDQLKPEGYFALSVMNRELTEGMIPDTQKGDTSLNPEMLFDLKPSNIMQTTGNIFQPGYLVLDVKQNLIYRKEQFMDDEELPAEYIIRDKRYSKREIIDMMEAVGFKVKKALYVQAGHFDVGLDALDNRAKEIFVLAQRR